MLKQKRKINNLQRSGKTYAIIYCRVSSDRQANEGHGLDSQENRCRQYANQRGYEVVEVFKDSFTGGGDFMKRPAMSNLLSFVEKNAYKNYVLIFDDLKRFARDVAKHWELRHLFMRLGITLESPNFEFNDKSDEGWLNETVNAVFNEYDRRTNKRQVVQKMKSRIEQGCWTFGSKKGYTMVKSIEYGKICVPNEEGLILKQALEGFANGSFIRKVDACRFLVEKGFWSKQKPERYIDKLTNILKDSFYAGYIEYPKWEVSRRLGKHEAIISLETFEMIQKRLGKLDFGRRMRVDISDDFPLRGLIVCDDCGKHLTGAWTKGRNKRHPYYFCQNKDCINRGKSIRKEIVEKQFIDLIKETKLKKDISVLVGTIFDKVWKEEISDYNNNQKTLLLKKSYLENKITELTNLVLSSKVDVVKIAYENQIESVSRELEEIKEIHSCSDLIDLDIPYRTALDKANGLLKSPYSIWVDLSTKDKQDLFYFIFDQKLSYSKIEGYRTDKIPTVIRLFEEFVTTNSHDVEMAGIEPACGRNSYISLHV